MNDDKLRQEIAERCKTLRKRSKMTQEDLAKKSNVSLALLRAIEQGVRKLTLENAEAIAGVLNVRRDYLLCKDLYETADEMRYYAEKDAFDYAEAKFDSLVGSAKYLAGMDVLITDRAGRVVAEELQINHAPAPEKEMQMYFDALEELHGTLEDSGTYYCSFRDKDGKEAFRLSVAGVRELIDEIAEFAEFKIRKLCKGGSLNAIRQRETNKER